MIHFRWDLDKTYLHTEFDSLRDLVRTFRQSAEEKRSVAGAATLLRELLAPATREEPRHVTFISGSPRQMRRVLEAKLRLDGIEPDRFILKPNLSNLLRFRFRALNEQLGYKLDALLRSRLQGDRVEEVLFGDDAESDALIYSLYADILAGAIDRDELAQALAGSSLYRRDAERILDRVDDLGDDHDRVRRIFIHLDRRSPTGRFDGFGARVVPIYNYFQAAVVLHGEGLLRDAALIRIIESMGADGYTPLRLANSFQDLIRRGFLASGLARRILALIDTHADVLGQRASLYVSAFRSAVATVELPERRPLPWAPDVDYVARCAETSRYHRARAALGGIGILVGDDRD
jgi:hypothetical protein